MRYILDTGILLRLVNRDAPLHEEVRKSVRLLKSRGDVATTAYQNLAESGMFPPGPSRRAADSA